MNRFLLFSIIALLFFSCDTGTDPVLAPDSNSSTPNILLIIADDLGKDAISGFTEGSIKPNTPNIDAIRNTGLSFNNVWVYPTCTPTRSSILTGNMGIVRM
jgi:arylsulfatase A-like enzyme